MACYHPNIMVKDENGEWKFMGAYRGSVHEATFKLDGRRHLLDPDTGEICSASLSDFCLVPCGRCSGCRIDRSRDWANRLMMEKSLYDDSEVWFLTLTYDPDHAPVCINPDGNEVLSLIPEHVSQFMKRLRTYTGLTGIRFYAAGEYGEHSRRPHYHLILFGIPEETLKAKSFGQNPQGAKYYQSEIIDKCWKFGFTVLASVTWDVCAYVARYVTKKLIGDAADWYRQQGIHPEFARMSLRPAIGKEYYVKHKDQILHDDKIFLSTAQGGKSFYPPAYIDKLIKEEFPNFYERNKAERKKKVEDVLDFKLSDFDGTYSDLLAAQETEFKNKIKKLKRRDL